jgi:16S rRNA (cytidine1402-2'-O)-methyltransferase
LTGILYLIPVTLGDDNINQVLPPEVVKIAQNLENFVVETEKPARHFLSTIKTAKPVRELTLNLLNEHTLDKDVAALLAPLLAGKDVVRCRLPWRCRPWRKTGGIGT